MNDDQIFMPFPKSLINATFFETTSTFLAEMLLPDNTQVTAYCANPGALNGCLESGSPAYLGTVANNLKENDAILGKQFSAIVFGLGRTRIWQIALLKKQFFGA